MNRVPNNEQERTKEKILFCWKQHFCYTHRDRLTLKPNEQEKKEVSTQQLATYIIHTEKIDVPFLYVFFFFSFVHSMDLIILLCVWVYAQICEYLCLRLSMVRHSLIPILYFVWSNNFIFVSFILKNERCYSFGLNTKTKGMAFVHGDRCELLDPLCPYRFVFFAFWNLNISIFVSIEFFFLLKLNSQVIWQNKLIECKNCKCICIKYSMHFSKCTQEGLIKFINVQYLIFQIRRFNGVWCSLWRYI